MTREIRFYHCTRRPAPEVGVQIARRVLDAGERLLLVAAPERLETIDMLLWTEDPASFLAHGRVGDGDEARQPILLADAVPPGEAGRHLLLLDQPLPDARETFPRLYLVFEDGGPGHADARAAWKALAGGTETRSYWQQKEGGGWVQRG